MRLQYRRPGFDPWVRKIPWRRKWQPMPVSLPGKSHGQRSLVGYSPWGHKEFHMTELITHNGTLTTVYLSWASLLNTENSSKSYQDVESQQLCTYCAPTMTLRPFPSSWKERTTKRWEVSVGFMSSMGYLGRRKGIHLTQSQVRKMINMGGDRCVN